MSKADLSQDSLVWGAYSWQSKERHSNQSEGGSQQTSVPGDGELVSIANGC